MDEIISWIENNPISAYSDIMESIVSRYNILRKKYQKSTGIPLEKFLINDYEYSNSKKQQEMNSYIMILYH